MSNTNQLPLTKSQELLWIGQKLNPDLPINNVPYAFAINGSLNIDAFKEAFQHLIDKADVLRIVFDEVNGEPYQRVIASWHYDLPIVVMPDKASVTEWLELRSKAIFDLSKPLFDSALLKLEEDSYIWYLNLHHLITDASSSLILFNLMESMYRHVLNDDLEDLPPAPSFTNFLAYENAQRSSKDMESVHRNWKEISNKFAPVQGFYGNNNKNVGAEAERIVIDLSEDQTNMLRRLANTAALRSWTKEMSMLNVTSALLYSFLYRISGQKSIAIGLPIHNRSIGAYKDALGLFIEVFPMGVEIDDDDTFTSLCEKVKLSSMEVLKNAEIGSSSGEAHRSFNVILNYITTHFSDFAKLPTHTTWIHPGYCDASHHMRCHIYDFNNTGQLQIVFDLNTEIFDKKTINKLPGQFIKLFDAVLNNPNEIIGSHSLLGSLEIQSSAEKNIDYSTIDKTFVLEEIERLVHENPSSIALEYNDVLITYGELNDRSNQLAHFLRKMGVSQEQKVAVHLKRSPNYIICLLAIMKLGATFIPIASNQPTARVKFIIEDSSASLILTQDVLKDNFSETTVPLVNLNEDFAKIANEPISNYSSENRGKLAYVLYTSGSTGNPKGVLISHTALSNYLLWASDYYQISENTSFPLFTSIGFDLTITSTFLPLINGGTLFIYEEPDMGPDVSLFQVLATNKVNAIKLTPSHLDFLKDRDLSNSKIHTMIVGGEDFKSELARSITASIGNQVKIFNEYGPTEATVGCVVSRFDVEKHSASSVAIGQPIKNMKVYVLDRFMNMVPDGVIGELFLGGVGLAEGYLNLPELNAEKFINDPFLEHGRLYRTGDLVRINKNNEYEYHGRSDEQVKLRGFRIELPDIEANLNTHPSIKNSAVVLVEGEERIAEEDVINCRECGLPSNYPTADFDSDGVCHICNSFNGYKEKVDQYFRTEEDLKTLLTSVKGKNPNYDCLSLLSGGKDSTYILAQLVNMGMKVLAFTLDNGYISEQAKTNIDNIVQKLGVDHVYGSTEHMNKIFVDSLNRHKNVCDGCFKTIYTLSTQIALEKKIPFIVTGLSRGQFFETRLTEELFWNTDMDAKRIDDTILEARKLYHKEKDAVRDLLDVKIFDDDTTFNKVQFVDFYRYSDVSLEEMIRFLEDKIDWKRPTDTGRSTNCLINQVGIYVHKKQKGYSNYSFPYSWDVRLGHKTRQETLDEINEFIYEDEVQRIMHEIGYVEPVENDMEERKLVGYYTGSMQLKSSDLARHLRKELPDYMVPSHFKYVDEFPLTNNGKVDKKALRNINLTQLEMETPFVSPDGEIEELLALIWKEVLKLKQIGAQDDFIALGGHSLAAIRVTARLNDELELNLPLNKIFEYPTISKYAKYLEQTLTTLLEE